jgi:hypothetical protein
VELLSTIVVGQLPINNPIPGANLYVNSLVVNYYGTGSIDYYMYFSPNILVQWGWRASPGNDAATNVIYPKRYNPYFPTVWISQFGDPALYNNRNGPAVVNSSLLTVSSFICDANVGGSYKPGVTWLTIGQY